MSDQFDKRETDVLITALYADMPEIAAALRADCATAAQAGATSEELTTLLLAREQIAADTTGEAPSLTTLYRFSQQLRMSISKTDATEQLADVVYRVYTALGQRTASGGEQPLSIEATLHHALALCEARAITSSSKLMSALDAAPIAPGPTAAKKDTALVLSDSPIETDDATARSAGFPDSQALALFCKNTGITARDLDTFIFAVKELKVPPTQIERVLSEGTSLDTFVRQLRISAEHEITIIESIDDDTLSAKQRSALRNDLWSIESKVLDAFCEHFGFSDEVSLEDNDDLMRSLEDVMRSFNGNLNDAVSAATRLGEQLGERDLGRLLESITQDDRMTQHGDDPAPETIEAPHLTFVDPNETEELQHDSDEEESFDDRHTELLSRDSTDRPWARPGSIPPSPRSPASDEHIDANDDDDDLDIPDMEGR